jgi:hypothetical protein
VRREPSRPDVVIGRSTSELRALLLLLCLALGAFVVAASALTFGRQSHRSDVIETQLRILEGGPAVFGRDEVYLPTNQNRIMVPLALAAVIGMGTPMDTAYVAVRFATAVIMFLGVAWILYRTTLTDERLAGVTLVTLACALVPSFNYGWEQPSDFPDVLFMIALAAAGVGGRRAVMIALTSIAAANRESAAFSGVIWACLHGRANRHVAWREIVFAGGLSATALVSVLTLRSVFGGPAAIGSTTQTLAGFLPALDAFAGALRHPSPTSWLALLAVMFAPTTLWLHVNRGQLDAAHKGLIVAAVAVFVITVYFGLVSELRRHLPALALLLYAAAASERGWCVQHPAGARV